jgi:hypothetical protein
MSDLTRRGFLTRGSIGVAVAGALAVVPGLASLRPLTGVPISGSRSWNDEPLVAHVRDLASGEIALLVGTNQIIIRDRHLALRLHAAARPAR